MFVQCIVASEVIRVAEGVETREAMLRDMALYGLSIVGVLVFFSLGQVGAAAFRGGLLGGRGRERRGRGSQAGERRRCVG